MFKFVFIALLGVSISIIAQDNIQDFSYGKVNWSKKIITVTGSGAPTLNSKNPSKARLNAERAAKMDAYRNVLEVVKGLKIKSSLSIEQEMEGDKKIATHVHGVIRGGVVKGKKYYDDGGVDIILEVPLNGIIPLKKYLKKEKVELKKTGKKNYTTLIIDMGNVKFEKVLLPEIMNESGKLIYSLDCVGLSVVKKDGIVTYTKQLSDAKKIAGKNPIIIKAKSVHPQNRSVAVISDTDSKKILGEDVNLDFLSEGKVIFVVK